MILCCGEALIDMIPHDTVTGGTGYVPFPGGAVFNTAIALGRLGCPVSMLSGVSTDGFGDQLCQALVQSNVAIDHLVRSEKLTTLAVVQLTDGHARYSFYDTDSAGQAIGSEDLKNLNNSAELAFFGGISLCNAPAADVYAELAIRQGAVRPVMLDPNIRPGFADDEVAYRDRIMRMIAAATIVKFSDEDLEWLINDGTLDDKINKVLSMGPKLVLLTRGASGSDAIHTNGTRVTIDAEAVAVVDTVGAGDTFNAGFLAALHNLNALSDGALERLNTQTLANALSYANKVAAVTVSRAGANPPWLTEL